MVEAVKLIIIPVFVLILSCLVKLILVRKRVVIIRVILTNRIGESKDEAVLPFLRMYQ